MELTFKYKDLQKVVALAKAEGSDVVYIAGDQGVYVGYNSETKPNQICYANECNPNEMEFDEWWDNKRESWGGDDSVEAITVVDIETWLKSAFDMTSKTSKIWTPTLELTPESIQFTITTK